LRSTTYQARQIMSEALISILMIAGIMFLGVLITLVAIGWVIWKGMQ